MDVRRGFRTALAKAALPAAKVKSNPAPEPPIVSGAEAEDAKRCGASCWLGLGATKFHPWL